MLQCYLTGTRTKDAPANCSYSKGDAGSCSEPSFRNWENKSRYSCDSVPEIILAVVGDKCALWFNKGSVVL